MRIRRPPGGVGKAILLQLDRVTKRFGGLVAVREVELQVNEGEIVGLIGPNGSGKTTLFNVVTGFYQPDGGRIRLRGRDVTGLSAPMLCRAGIARTFQLVRPFPNLTVRQNVAVGRLYGRERSRDRHHAEEEALEVLQYVGLAHRADVPAHSLTLVQRKRLELARALATRPILLLLDELLAGLNPSEVVQEIEFIKGIRDSGVTIILVEHLVKAIFGVSDRVVVLNAGEKIAEGTPAQIAADPHVIDAYLGMAHDHD